MNFATMDDFDRAILRVVQRDSSLTHEAIGARVNLSASSVRRRLSALRDSGLIQGEVALVDSSKVGVTMIVTVTLSEETPEVYSSLDAVFLEEEPVKQSYHVAGDDDYVLIVQSASVQSYEEWSRRVLMASPYVKRFDTRVALSRQKFDTSVAID